jgi:hypothetical protein
MAIYNYQEAIYAALCYIYGDDDNRISAEEKAGVKPKFLERHDLSNESMEKISVKWSKEPLFFCDDIVSSLNECSPAQKLEAYKAICAIINDLGPDREDRWIPANKIREGLGISKVENNNTGS